MEPIDESDLDWSEREHDDHHVRRKQLGADGGDRLGCSLYELPAGKRSWPYHYHTANEEAIYVLDGTATLRLDGDEYALESGDYVPLPAGEDSAHQMINPGQEAVRYLVISTMDEPEVLCYPDSGRVGIMVGDPPGGEQSERDLEGYFPLDARVDFWDGE